MIKPFTLDIDELETKFPDTFKHNRYKSLIELGCMKGPDLKHFIWSDFVSLTLDGRIRDKNYCNGFHMIIDNITPYIKDLHFIYNLRDKEGKLLGPFTKEQPLLLCYMYDNRDKFVETNFPTLFSATAGWYDSSFMEKILSFEQIQDFQICEKYITRYSYSFNLINATQIEIPLYKQLFEYIEKKKQIPSKEIIKIHELTKRVEELEAVIEEFYKPDGIMCQLAAMRFQKLANKKDEEENCEYQGL